MATKSKMSRRVHVDRIMATMRRGTCFSDMHESIKVTWGGWQAEGAQVSLMTDCMEQCTADQMSCSESTTECHGVTWEYVHELR